MLYGMRDFKVFTVTVEAIFMDLRRDWEGWAEGYGPSDNKWKTVPQNTEFKIVCRRSDQAEEKALSMFSLDSKDRRVIKIEEEKLDAFILEIGF